MFSAASFFLVEKEAAQIFKRQNAEECLFEGQTSAFREKREECMEIDNFSFMNLGYQERNSK